MTEFENILVQISRFAPAEILDVVTETTKAVQLKNVDNGAVCWVPKSALVLKKPGVPTFENEFILAGWFRDKLNSFQERALGVTC